MPAALPRRRGAESSGLLNAKPRLAPPPIRLVAVFIAGVAAFGSSAPRGAAGTGRPNVLFIAVDARDRLGLSDETIVVLWKQPRLADG